MPARPTRRLAPALLLALVAALAAAPAASAQSAAAGTARDLARGMAAPWPDLQLGTGHLPDFMDAFQSSSSEGTRYGDSMVGYGLVQTGLRERDDEMVRTGVRAITYAIRQQWLRPSSFEAMAVAAAYRMLRARVPRMPEFAEDRARWEAWMRGFRTTRLQVANRFGNHWLVDALAVIELQRTGLRSHQKGTVLGGGRTTARRAALRLINVRVPRAAGDDAAILSDPPDQPLAYQGLSAGMYARAVKLLGGAAAPAARRTLRRVVRGSQLSTGPDGDTSYWGRSQQQVWAPTATAYGAEVAAGLPDTGAAAAAADHALAARTLGRVAALYPADARGTLFVPSLAQDFDASARAQEGYAGAPSMGGLGLVTLNWIVEDARDARPAGAIPADGDVSAVLSHGAGRFAVVRRGSTWFAVKVAHATRPYSRDDVRYDFGLHVAKRLGAGGWTDLVPQRPRTAGAPGTVSAGPVLLTGGPAYPQGSRISVTPGGVVSVSGSFVTEGGRALRRGKFAYAPVECGVELSFRGEAGSRYELAAFFRDAPEVAGPSAADAEQRVTVDPPPESMSVDGATFTSAKDAHLRRLRIVVGTPVARTVRLRFCAA